MYWIERVAPIMSLFCLQGKHQLAGCVFHLFLKGCIHIHVVSNFNYLLTKVYIYIPTSIAFLFFQCFQLFTFYWRFCNSEYLKHKLYLSILRVPQPPSPSPLLISMTTTHSFWTISCLHLVYKRVKIVK